MAQKYVRGGGQFSPNSTLRNGERVVLEYGVPKFTTDGCSGGMSWFWRTFLRKAPPWEHHCFWHDIAYWRGGFYQDRLDADVELFRGVCNEGYPWVATLMFVAVRAGGAPFFPTPWRWGYGWQFSGRYEKIGGHTPSK